MNIDKKKSRFRGVSKFNKYIFILIFIYFLISTGATYAYYAFQVEEESVITGNVVAIDAELDVQLVSGTNQKMVPLYNGALHNAINGIGSTNGACIDKVGNVSCQVYKITLTNKGSRLKNLIGTVELYAKPGMTNKYTNLKWRELSSKTAIKENSIINGMNKSTLVSDLTIESKEEKIWYIAVWISEVSNSQHNDDFGLFGGTVTFDINNEETETIESVYMNNLFSTYEDETYYKSDTYREYIKTASFVNYIETDESKIIESWDVTKTTSSQSVSNDSNKVVIWIENNSSNGYYDLYIGANNKMVTLTNMIYFFYGLASLENASFNYLDTSNVTNMEHMFRNCSNLKTLDLSNFDTRKVTLMGSMFKNCTKLESLNVSSFDTSIVTNMDQMFYGCGYLKNLNLSSFATNNVTNMNSMFSYCNKLISLNLSNFNTSNVTDMKYMFNYCISLTSIDVSNFNTSKVTTMYGMFKDCNNLIYININDFKTGDNADISHMFQGCSSLKYLDLSDFDTSKVIDMAYMFSDCTNLKELDLNNFITTNVTEMQYMFHNCTSLKEVDLSDFNTSKVINMSYMFGGAENLKTDITIMNANTTYTDMFRTSATATGAQITVNYTSATSSLVDSMIATKSSNSKVTKGTQV